MRGSYDILYELGTVRVFPVARPWLRIWVKCCSHMKDTLSTWLMTETMFARFQQIKLTSLPYILSELFREKSLCNPQLWNSPELFGEIFLSPIYFLIWACVHSLGVTIQYPFIHSFCSWDYSRFGQWGLCWLLSRVALWLWAGDKLPHFVEGTRRHFRPILDILLVSGLESTLSPRNLGTEEKLGTKIQTTTYLFLNAKQ